MDFLRCKRPADNLYPTSDNLDNAPIFRVNKEG
jgi:hypothetical protein